MAGRRSGYEAVIDETPDQRRLLSIYLNDHLTGATAGVDLVRRAAASSSGAIASELSGLAEAIAQDRDELLSIMAALDVSVQRWKAYAGWVSEKVARLKLNGRITGRSPLSTLVELEALRMAVQGKQSGWEALRRSGVGAAEADRLGVLAQRAQTQLAKLTDLHAAAAEELFASHSRAR